MVVNPFRKWTDDELLAELKLVGDEIVELKARRPVLYARRLALWMEGRRRVPPIKLKALGDAASTSDVDVSVALGKVAKQKAGD